MTKRSDSSDSLGSQAVGHVPPVRGQALVIDEDRFISGLVDECLVALGFGVTKLSPADLASANLKHVELVVVDVNPRRDRENALLRQLAGKYPGAVILAISASVCSSSIECVGALALRLKVAKVLAKPFSCEAFSNTVRALVPPH